MAQRKVVLVHTSFAVIDLFNKLFDEMMPHVKRIHIVEHSLIQDILDAMARVVETMDPVDLPVPVLSSPRREDWRTCRDVGSASAR